MLLPGELSIALLQVKQASSSSGPLRWRSVASSAHARTEKVARVQVGIAQKIESIAVVLIASRPGHDIHHAAAVVSIFRVEVTGEDAKFGDGIKVRRDGGAHVHALFNVAAVDHETVGHFAVSAD